MKKMNILFLCICSVLFCGHCAHAVSFSSADLEGEWRGYFLESWIDPDDGDSFSFWIYGDITVSQAGAVAGGRWTAVSGIVGDFVDGSLTIDKGGVLIGTLSIHEDGTPSEEILEMTLVHAKMDKGKELVQGVIRKADGNMDLVTFVRKEVASLSLNDLDGDWLGFHHYTDANQIMDHWFDNVSIQNGVVVNGAWSSVLADNSGVLIGAFAVDDATDSVSWDLMNSYTDTAGHLHRSRLVSQSALFSGSKSVLSGIDVRNNSSFMDIGLYLKTGDVDYQAQDLQGTWAGYFSEISSSGWVYWIYGAITLDAAGNCTAGTWEAASGIKGTFTGGTVSLAADGKLSGTLSSSDGEVMTIRAGFMDTGKSMAAAVVKKDGGTADLVYLLKMEPNFSWPMFLPAVTHNASE